jgi:hypothetical protein
MMTSKETVMTYEMKPLPTGRITSTRMARQYRLSWEIHSAAHGVWRAIAYASRCQINAGVSGVALARLGTARAVTTP